MSGIQILLVFLGAFGTYGFVHFIHDTIKFIVEMRYEAKKFKEVKGALDAIQSGYHQKCQKIMQPYEDKQSES